MAFAFPLSQAQFLDQLRVQSARFWLPESLTLEGTEGGEIFTADRGPRLWQAEFTLAQGHHHSVDEDEARLAMLAQAGRSFLAYDPRRTGPKADPEGAGLAGFTPKISTALLHKSADGRGSPCSIPDDHISPRRSALFMARSVLRELRDGGQPC